MTGADLARRRHALSMTQAQLAAHLQVARETLARWEIGEDRIARPNMIVAMLDALDAAKVRAGK